MLKDGLYHKRVAGSMICVGDDLYSVDSTLNDHHVYVKVEGGEIYLCSSTGDQICRLEKINSSPTGIMRAVI